jgi:hypothetical protein
MTKPKPRPAAASERNAVNLKDQTPFELLRYERTPTLVWSLAQAHRAAGGISAMRFGYYAQKRLEAQVWFAKTPATLMVLTLHVMGRDTPQP